jgi:hypothetical protein
MASQSPTRAKNALPSNGDQRWATFFALGAKANDRLHLPPGCDGNLVPDRALKVHTECGASRHPLGSFHLRSYVRPTYFPSPMKCHEAFGLRTSRCVFFHVVCVATQEGALGGLDAQMKAQAIQALTAGGFREVGTDGSGLRLFSSVSGCLLIGVGSCRSLAYSPTGPGGRLQLVAASNTAALVCRITSLNPGASRLDSPPPG